MIHLGYKISQDKKWISVVWTDDLGESLDIESLKIKSKPKEAFDSIWKHTCVMASNSSHVWRVVIVKNGDASMDVEGLS